MGVEIIKRSENLKVEKDRICYDHPQISFNSDNHLVVRLMQNESDDILLVFDSKLSSMIIDFCQAKINNNYICKHSIDRDCRLPF